MVKKKDYSEWSKTELVKEIKKLEKRKKYGIVWEDKPEKVATLCKEKLPILEEDTKKEIKTDDKKPINILIEGDNYHALSVLNYTHKGKVDVIYIDPPYNTGNKDFVYNDRFVDREDGYRHSKWLSFIGKRLNLCKNLLKNKGVIFISIDNNECAQLKLLCDEIFGENNFVCDFIWKKRSGGGYTNTLVNYSHEYILAYSKNISRTKFNDKVKDEKKISKIYKFKDKKGLYKRRDLRKSGSADLRTDRPTMYYAVTAPDGSKVFPIRPDGRDGRWACGEKKYNELLEQGEVEFVKVNGKYKPYTKERPFDINGETKKEKYESLLLNVAINTQGTNELKNIFVENDTIFNNPKPVNLIKHLVKIASNKESLILDFFAGSGTTGQSVLELNQEDEGNRKFILCTDNQDNNGSGLKIATDICYPRIERVIKGYKNLKKEKVEGLGSSLKYFKTGFVDAEPTDENKKKMVDKSTEMLCLKEDCFNEVKKGKEFKIFKNSQDKYLGIIYDDDGIEPFKREVKKLNKQFVVYVFSLDESAREEEFEDFADIVELKPIPAVILNVYKRIFK